MIGVEPEAADLVRFFSLCREDDDRNVVSLCADLLQHLVAVDARQHQVEQNQLRLPLIRLGDRRPPVLGDSDIVALEREVVLDARGQVGIVFDDENA